MSPIETIVLFLICLFLTWLYQKWTVTRQYWAVRDVPYLPPHPILGNLTFISKENAGVWLRKIYNQIKTPYLGIWFFWKPALVINSPNIARNILIKDSHNFRNRHIKTGVRDKIGGLVLFSLRDPLWTKVRRSLATIFSKTKLKCLEKFIQRKCVELKIRIGNETENQDIRSMYADFTTDVIGTSAFGVADSATLTGASPLRIITKEFMKYSIYRGLSWISIFFLPEVVDIFRFTLFPKSITSYFTKVFDNIITQRTAGTNTRDNKDLLDALLEIKTKTADYNEEFSNELLLAQSANFLQAGFDTTAVTLTYVTYELAFDSESQEKLYKELLNAKKRIGNAQFDSETLSNLPYLNCVIKETLRKYPPMGWLDRMALEDYVIDDKLMIRSGTPVIVNVMGLHFDPDFFPNPYKFDPDRFLPANKDKVQPFTYLPFGYGPRNCIGLNFANMTLTHAISSIFLNYKVMPLPNTATPLDVEVEKNSLLYMPGEALKVKFVNRLKEKIL